MADAERPQARAAAKSAAVESLSAELAALHRRVDRLERSRIRAVAWLGIVVVFVSFALPAVIYTSGDDIQQLRPFTLPWDVADAGTNRYGPVAVLTALTVVGLLWALLGASSWAGLPNRLRWWGLVGQIFLAVGLLGETVLAWGAPPDEGQVSPGPGLWMYLIGFSVGVAAQLMTIGYRARSAGD